MRPREKDSLLSSALDERIKEDDLLVTGPAWKALLAEFSLSQSMDESASLYAEVREANPNAATKEFGRALRVLRVQAALTRGKTGFCFGVGFIF